MAISHPHWAPFVLQVTFWGLGYQVFSVSQITQEIGDSVPYSRRQSENRVDVIFFTSAELEKAEPALRACWESTQHPSLLPTAASGPGPGTAWGTAWAWGTACTHLLNSAYRISLLLFSTALKTTFGVYFICHKLYPSIPSCNHQQSGRNIPSPQETFTLPLDQDPPLPQGQMTANLGCHCHCGFAFSTDFYTNEIYNLLCLASFSLSIIYFGSIHLAMHVINLFLNFLSFILFFSFACD